MSKTKLKSSLIQLAGVGLMVHVLSFVLYAVWLNAALAEKFGVLSNLQFHSLLLMITLPGTIALVVLEKRLQKRLSLRILAWFFGMWCVAMTYVLLQPEPKVMDRMGGDACRVA